MGGSLRFWTTVVLLGKAVAQDYSNVGQYSATGCYSRIPDSFSNQGSSSSNSGLDCYTKCNNAGYSVMAVQNENCYCGNEVPAGSADGTCDVPCPGYGSDQCGGSSAYNIYVKKGAAVSTAAGSDSSSSSTTSSTSASASSSAASSSSSSSESGSTLSASASASSTSESSSSASSQAPSQATTTVSGSVVVSTVTASQSASSQSSSSSTSTHSESATGASDSTASAAASSAASKHSGVSGGAIAGIVVGVVVGLAVVAALLFFLWRRRKDEFYSPNSSPHKFETSFNSGYNQEYPSIIDQRLNPQLLNHRISIASLADARDYSRQILKVANPDEKE